MDLFAFFGRHNGKAAVLAMYANIAASLTAAHKQTGRTLTMRLAYFAQLQGDKVVRMRALLDSFDFAEQALGREIDLTSAA